MPAPLLMCASVAGQLVGVVPSPVIRFSELLTVLVELRCLTVVSSTMSAGSDNLTDRLIVLLRDLAGQLRSGRGCRLVVPPAPEDGDERVGDVVHLAGSNARNTGLKPPINASSAGDVTMG